MSEEQIRLRVSANEGLRIMRKRAFDDALAGRPKADDHPVYSASYRRGAARRELLQGGGMEQG